MNEPMTESTERTEASPPLRDPYLDIYERLHHPRWREAVLAALALSALGWMLTRRR